MGVDLEKRATADAANEREARLAEIVSQLADQVRAGSLPDIDRVVERHPDLADELRELWTALLVADCVAAGASSSGAPSSSAEAPTVQYSPHEPTTAPVVDDAPLHLGDYELLEELGRGGMGVVYRARQLSLNRIVALKLMLRGSGASDVEKSRFRLEAEAAARLDHPQIVPIYEVGEIDGRPYFTMKFIEGTTLARKLAAGPLGAKESAELLMPICHAIHYAHRSGVLHRDLKPANILIDNAGRPHVGDFGLAKQLESNDGLTLSGAIVGTPSYMAPEQAAGRRGTIGPGTDVWSLGAVLYQSLTGRPPFQAASPVETVLLLLEQEPLPPRLLNPRADHELEMIALKCLQKPLELRYESAVDLARDLEAYLADEPTSARAGLFRQVIARAFRETHHAVVLENWGLLWILHSAVLLLVCFFTTALQWLGTTSPFPYLSLWTIGLGSWAAIFWTLRRRAGPVTFVERQIAHVWAASMVALALLYPVEMILGLPVLSLSPVLALTSGMVFLIKAGILTGKFYIQAAALFATAFPMALLQRWQIPLDVMLFGVVSALCFFLPGWKYYRQRGEAEAI